MCRRVGPAIVVPALLVALLTAARPSHPVAARQAAVTATPASTATPTATSTATQLPTSTSLPTATPPVNARPDACEENNGRDHACMLELNTVAGPFTFLPIGDQDWYRVEPGEANGLQTTVTVRTSGKLDLLVSISYDDGTPLATFGSPAISTTLGAEIVNPIIIRVENRSPDDPTGQSYNVEVRKTLPPPPPAPEGVPALQPDRLENNWDPAHAAPIGVGVVYDLNFVCPVSWGCGGGDHDYLRLRVKANIAYLIATFDLGPGVDTVLDLFWSSEQVPIATNDDARYGASFLSVLRWTAPGDGEAIIRVGPRTGALTPIVFDEKASSYRFVVALQDSDLATQLEARIAEQTNAPTPTAAPAPMPDGSAGSDESPAPTPNMAAPAVPPIAGDAPKGPAVVIAPSTVLREGPGAEASAIQDLPQETIVTLLGHASGPWVRAQPENGVVPGWVYGPDLQPFTARASPMPAPLTPGAGAPTTGPSSPPAPPQPTAIREPLITQLEDVPPTLPSAPAQRVPLVVSVQVVAALVPPIHPTSGPAGTKATPTPGPQRPLAQVRVQLVNVFGDVLVEAITPASGQVTLTRDVLPGTAVRVRLPAYGLEATVDPAQPRVTFALPENLPANGGTP